MEFSIQEIIELIINCKYSFKYIKETAMEIPEAHKAINCGFLHLNDNNEYELTNEGEEFLHVYIKSISQNFINFMKSKGYEYKQADIFLWYSSTYNIDLSTSKEIYNYICDNLERYKYKAFKSLRDTDKCILRKL